MKEYLERDDLDENIVIIKINRSYRKGMSALELYDVTRGCWKRKIESVQKAEYALSVCFGEVKEVYQIDCWVTSEKMKRETKPYDEELDGGRIAFFGKVADDDIRRKYIGKYVNKLYKRGDVGPVKTFFSD